MFRVLVQLLFVLGALVAQQLEATSSCSAASIKGRYAYLARGTQPKNGTVVGRVGVGSAIYDGSGSFSGWSIGKTNLTLTNQTFTGNYTVDPKNNCLVSFTNVFLGTTAVPLLAGWIGASGEIFTVQNGSLTAKTWEFYPAPTTCSAASVKGTYVWDGVGTAADGTPYGYAASATFDGTSSVTSNRWVVLKGLTTETGTYSVSDVCQLSWSTHYIGSVFNTGFTYIDLAAGVSEAGAAFVSNT